MALAAAAKIVAGQKGLALRAVVIDHGLQAAAAQVAELTCRRLEALNIEAVIVAVEVLPCGEGLEAAARDARYAALTAAASPDEVILLGHTLDDQAETVLLGLVRGSGIRSLSGMPVSRGQFLRPLLEIERATTRQACIELGLKWWDDPHNQLDCFTRVRIRNRVLPVLESEIGPGITAALSRTAALARIDADYLDSLAAAWDKEMDAKELEKLPDAIRLRVIRDWLQRCGARDFGATHIMSVDALITDWHGQKHVAVPGLTIRRESHILTAAPNNALQ